MANNVWVNITDLLWPVGSIYSCWNFSNDPTDIADESPANYFGGSWIGPIANGSTSYNGEIYYQWKFFRIA